MILWPQWSEAEELYPRRNAVVKVVEKVGPAVVNINTEEIIRERVNPFRGFSSPMFDEFFRDFFEPFMERDYKRQSLGSGVIIDPKGYILTNEHVVSRATSIRVILIDNREFEAQLIGADARSDLAVIKIEGEKELPYIEMGHSDDLMPGETVIAIGNPFGLSHTVTTGIISALHRSIKGGKGRIYSDFIQLDASINPGNSGGPLLNINGELIGINTAIYQEAQGIGFAIPIDRAKRIVDDLINYGQVEDIWLGIMVQDINPEIIDRFQYPYNYGVIISRVSKGSPGQEARLQAGDIIQQIEGQKIRSSEQYLDLISSYTINDKIPLTYFRQGQVHNTTLVARSMPLALVEEVARELIGVSVARISLAAKLRYRLYTTKGVVISQVESGSPADKIGIKPGDVIRQINSLRIENLQDFKKAITSLGDSNSLLLLIQRGPNGYYITLEL
jgi:serine protease Do